MAYFQIGAWIFMGLYGGVGLWRVLLLMTGR